MIEIYYRKPEDLLREERITSIIVNSGGKLTYKESDSPESICLTAEFDSWEFASSAAATLRESCEHVEGPADYGDS